jgi:enoyl-CoA hydratase/carnithine racemase
MNTKMESPPVQGCLVSFPTPQILLLTINRPEQRNSIPLDMSADIQRLWKWFDSEPSLQVAIITGTGKSFCSGADLKGDTHAAHSGFAI